MTRDWLGRATSLIKVTVGYQNVSTSVSMLASVHQVLRGKNKSYFGHKCEIFDDSPITCGFISQPE